MNHKETLIRAIRFEIEFMDDKASQPIGNLSSPSKMLECAIEQLNYTSPYLDDVLHYIEKTQLEMMGATGYFEIRLRLIELAERIEREWKLV